MKHIFDRKYAILLSCLIIISFYLIFVRFFPNNNGRLGSDFSIGFPNLLDGVFWYHNNGLFKAPWFTPSWGGGLPKFPNPQSMYYSVPQFLCFITNPLISVKLTLLLFGCLGFAGFYLLLRRIFLTSRATALLGATLFLFNGFFAHRMIIGHLSFHAFMLFPLLVFFTLHYSKENGKLNKKIFFNDIVLGACIIAYMIYSGAFGIMPIMVLGLFIILMLYNLVINSSLKYIFFFLKLGLIFLVGFSLAASQLNASFSYLSFFPRDFYPLPGYRDIYGLIIIFFRSLFGMPPNEYANTIYVNNVFSLQRHEYEYGVTFIPLVILIIAMLFYVYKVYKKKIPVNLAFKNIIKIFIFILLLAIPLSLNYYTPSWNSILKSIPFIKNSSSSIRWISVYIPVIILLTCISFENLMTFLKKRNLIAFICIFLIIFNNITSDRKYYHNEPYQYQPKGVLDTYKKLKEGKFIPEITHVGTEVTIDGKIIFGNDLLIAGYSQLVPYEPIFGYRQEKFPKKSLMTGSILQQNSAGILNIKNPASYVFPEENKCTPGDHFTLEQKENAERFSKYLDYPFNISSRQKFANYLTIISLCLLIIFLTYNGIILAHRITINSSIQVKKWQAHRHKKSNRK